MIMYLGQPFTTTKSRGLIGMAQYYRYMWPRRSHVLAPLIEAASGSKGRRIFWNDALENSFKELVRMVSTKTLIIYTDWKLSFTVHTDASDKQLSSVISNNNKPIDFFSMKLSKPWRNYTMTEKELLAILEFLKQFQVIIFGYEINLFSDHKNLFYAVTLSGSQRVMRWRLIIEEFGPNIQHIAGVDNIVADMLSRLPSTPSNKYNPCTRKA